MSKPIVGLSEVGIIKDTPSLVIPENAFSDGRNVRFRNGAIESFAGETLYRELSSIQPTYGIHWRRPDQSYNIYLLNGKVVRADSAGNESVMLDSADSKYNNSEWEHTLFNGGYAVVINNGKSTPLYALYGGGTADNQFLELPGWNYSSGVTIAAKVVRTLGYSLVAANLTLTTGSSVSEAPSTVRISVQAATGAIPNIWTPGITTDTADEFELKTTSPILDMRELRGSLFIYSSDSISYLTINTGQSVVRPYIEGYGALNGRCVVEFDGQHFVVDRNDIYVHAGQGKPQSVADGRVRDYFFNTVNPNAIEKVFVSRNPRFDEIWVCFPSGTNNTCDRALVYGYRTNTWTIRDLPMITSIFNGPDNVGNSFSYLKEKPYMVTGTSRVFKGDTGTDMWNGYRMAPLSSYVERNKLGSANSAATTLISELILGFDKIPEGGNAYVSVTSQDNTNHEETFQGSTVERLPVDPTDESVFAVTPRSLGRLLNFKIESNTPWRLSLIIPNVQQGGKR
jgi:hypothetical protein